MLKLLKLVACVLLVQDLYTVDALAIGGCVDRLMASLTDGADTCLVVTEYVKCVLLETSLYKTLNKDEDLRLLKMQMEDALAGRGVVCDIDVMAIVEEHLENDRKGIERTTTRPTGYDNAKTVGDCINTFIGEIDDEVTCASLTPYLKCIIRVTKAYALTSSNTDQQRQMLDQTIKDRLSMLNIHCDFKWESLIEEVRREQGGDKGSSYQEGYGENGSSSQQGNAESGADMVLGSFPFVTLFILTCASVFVLHSIGTLPS